jgi:hypothetical protein
MYCTFNKLKAEKFTVTKVCYERNLEVLIDHLIDGDWAGGVEELVHVHLRVPLRGPVLLLQLYGRLHTEGNKD